MTPAMETVWEYGDLEGLPLDPNLAVCTLASLLTSLSLSFLICKMGMRIEHLDKTSTLFKSSCLSYNYLSMSVFNI